MASTIFLCNEMTLDDMIEKRAEKLYHDTWRLIDIADSFSDVFDDNPDARQKIRKLEEIAKKCLFISNTIYNNKNNFWRSEEERIRDNELAAKYAMEVL